MDKKKKVAKKLNKKVVLLGILILIVILAVIFTCIIISKNSKEKVFGNLANMGLAFSDGNTVYYNKYENGIVKVKSGKEYQITDETAYSINVVGDTIYYLTVSNTNSIDIKSVKTNGDSLKTVKSIRTSISKIYVENGYIYYATTQDSDGIVKINIETQEEERVNFANIKDFVVEKDIIYYVDNSNQICKINVSGSDSQVINGGAKLEKIQVSGKWIYYYDSNENALCKVKIDGSKTKIVSTFVNNEMYNITNKKIYYYDSLNKKICVSPLNGKKSKIITDVQTSKTKINIVNNVIYYLDKSDDETQIYQMYRIKTNGNNTKKIEY